MIVSLLYFLFFFVKQKTAYEMRISDWSSDVCSSDLYAAFNGLNLCFETREGILKHCSVRHARTLGTVGQRFIERTQPSLEAQIANLADEIAYNNHDIDDGLRSGLITVHQLQMVEIFATHYGRVRRRNPDRKSNRAIEIGSASGRERVGRYV